MHQYLNSALKHTADIPGRIISTVYFLHTFNTSGSTSKVYEKIYMHD